MTVKELKKYLADKKDDAHVYIWQHYEQEWEKANEYNITVSIDE